MTFIFDLSLSSSSERRDYYFICVLLLGFSSFIIYHTVNQRTLYIFVSFLVFFSLFREDEKNKGELTIKDSVDQNFQNGGNNYDMVSFFIYSFLSFYFPFFLSILIIPFSFYFQSFSFVYIFIPFLFFFFSFYF